jgi:hypothetical protein
MVMVMVDKKLWHLCCYAAAAPIYVYVVGSLWLLPLVPDVL